MSKYSETIGSFIRTGNYPLEADYTFNTEQDLIDFYTDNDTCLHQGLFKIVGEGDEQSLYWVIKDGDNLFFKKLLENVDRDNILSQLTNLETQLQQEITKREADVYEIWGDDKENILSSLNSIKKISDALNIEIKKLSKLHDEFNATIGVTDRDIIEYLKTLPYKSLTEISQVLDNFLNGENPDTSSIDTLPELQKFLEGINDSDTLINILTALWNDIQGTPLPSTEYRTLRGIEDKLISMEVTATNQHSNLQQELNTTQSGVGLNQDGSYSPDANSNYLQNSTSITNALHILDNLIYTALQEYNLEPSDTGNVTLSTEKTLTGYKISGNVKLNPDISNQLKADNNGLYYRVDVDYNHGTLTVKVNNQVIKQFNLGISNMVSDAFYDSTSENIVIDFNLADGTVDTVRIPVGNLIREWDVNNLHPDKVVELTREEVFGDGPDRLSADVRISSKSDNILGKDGNTLYVGKNAILEEVAEELLDLKEDLTTLINNTVEVEKSRAEAKEEALKELISAEVTRATAEEAQIRTAIADIVAQIPEINSKLNDLTSRVIALEIKTSW